ncbi:MAG: hypothetical protein K2P48_07610 [Lachnospiraceae bacterium]|nr:hypothetical protein [Lachnospiraceae bacterium]
MEVVISMVSSSAKGWVTLKNMFPVFLSSPADWPMIASCVTTFRAGS